jgi:uncharacterized protein
MTDGAGRWRRLRVARRRKESSVITSLDLVADDGGTLPSFEPGQFLTFRVPDGAGGETTRNYSLSSDPADCSRWRISVKREAEGIGSGYMHDAMDVGRVIEAAGPSGRFVLEAGSARPIILLAGGVGITPLLAMAHALAREGRRAATLVHACRDDAVRPFRDELAELAAHAPNLRVAACLERVAAVGEGNGGDIFEGAIDIDLLRRLLPIGDYEAYVCGPPAFMQAMYDLLTSLGVKEERIAYEFFGPATLLRRGGTAAARMREPTVPGPHAVAAVAVPVVRFSRSGREAAWDGAQRTLLDFAEAQGLQPAFSCRNGICNTCLCPIEGKVRYVEEPLEMPEDGYALLCCSVPDGPVTLGI